MAQEMVADGSTMAFPHRERSELTLIKSTPFGVPSAWMEGPAKPPLPPGVLAALAMLSRSSTTTALVASSVCSLSVSWHGPSGALGAMSVAA